eukprot:344809-Chlamydomonas_euryale.AAC.1
MQRARGCTLSAARTRRLAGEGLHAVHGPNEAACRGRVARCPRPERGGLQGKGYQPTALAAGSPERPQRRRLPSPRPLRVRAPVRATLGAPAGRTHAPSAQRALHRQALRGGRRALAQQTLDAATLQPRIPRCKRASYPPCARTRVRVRQPQLLDPSRAMDVQPRGHQ